MAGIVKLDVPWHNHQGIRHDHAHKRVGVYWGHRVIMRVVDEPGLAFRCSVFIGVVKVPLMPSIQLPVLSLESSAALKRGPKYAIRAPLFMNVQSLPEGQCRGQRQGRCRGGQAKTRAVQG